MLAADAYPALVLNADFRPLRTYPLARFSWRTSIEQLFAGKVIVVAEYDRPVRSEKIAVRIPSVVALKNYEDMGRPAPLTRLGLFTRDRFACVYCGERHQELTFDHVTPRSRGGASSWENLVAACLPCNLAKGNRSVEDFGVPLRHKPYRPTLGQLNGVGATLGTPPDIDASWRDWLYWTTTLEP